MINYDEKKCGTIGSVYEAMFLIRSTIHDNMANIGMLFDASEVEEIERIAVIADSVIGRLMKMHDDSEGEKA